MSSNDEMNECYYKVSSDIDAKCQKQHQAEEPTDSLSEWTRSDGRLVRTQTKQPQTKQPQTKHPPMFDRWKDDNVAALTHPIGWSATNHYMDMGWCWCGQSCPCCRAKMGEMLGGCEICTQKR